MLEKFKRMSKVLRLISFVILIALAGYIAWLVYDFYHQQFGLTSERVVETYFQSLASGDYNEVYRLTAKRDLTDIYGRPITQDEFLSQVERITGGKRFAFSSVRIVKLFDKQGSHYFAVHLSSNVGGKSGDSRVLVEVIKEDSVWVVIYPFAIVL